MMKMLQIYWVKWVLIPLGLIIPVALLVLSWHFGRRFADRGQGGIVLFSSIVGFQGMPNSTNYAATKAHVQSL